MIGVSALLIRGIVVENVVATSVRGHTLDRILHMRLNDGTRIQLFDDNYPFTPLSEHLVAGTTINVIIGMYIGTQCHYASHHPPSDHDGFGRVLLQRWFPDSDPAHQMLKAGPRLFHNGGGFAIVNTVIGPVLFGPDDVPHDAEVDDELTWPHLRYELLAFTETNPQYF